MTPDVAIRTPQFHALGLTNFFVGCCGFGLFSVAKPMMGEVFSSTLPAIVTAGFASAYVQVNMGVPHTATKKEFTDGPKNVENRYIPRG